MCERDREKVCVCEYERKKLCQIVSVSERDSE